MLVLTRKTRQQIQIGDNITVTILVVKGQTVRVGIEAPRNVRVLRAELPLHEDTAEPAASPRKKNTTRSESAKDASKSTVSDNSATASALAALRRRGSLASLTRGNAPAGSMVLRPLFERH